MNNNVLELDLSRYDGYSLDSGWNGDYHIRKVCSSKTHYTMMISDSGDYMGKRGYSSQYLSTTTIKINRRIKKSGKVLVNFEFVQSYNGWDFDCDSTDVSIEAFRTPNDFIGSITPMLDRFIDKMANSHNKFVENSK
jgi:hypothetical protein